MRLPFAKYLPGGNPTILVPGESVPAGALPALAARLMSPLHLGAEQVGALFTGAGTPHLEMMGGEFCVNASRAAAHELAERGFLRPVSFLAEPALAGWLSVSGLTEPALVAAAPTLRTLAACRAHLDAHGLPGTPPTPPDEEYSFCGARIPLEGATIERPEPGRALVRLPGICHLLLDARIHPLPSEPFTAAEAERSRFDLNAEPAAGVIWCAESSLGPSITPLVRVAATGSTHLETACGSASLALALARGASLPVGQPSGESLDIDLGAEHAWVSGRVVCIARGETWVDFSS